MAAKYQIFISSTFQDLQSERAEVSRAILDLGHIPAGMELFPAADMAQMGYIEKVIDECDYYVLIIGGRYGSINEDGISFTELEYRYAVSKGKTVLVFMHQNLNSIEFGKSEKNAELRESLERFRSEVSRDRLVQFWENISDLKSKCIISLTHTFASCPQVGWVRADSIAGEEALSEIVHAKREIENLRKENSILSSKIGNPIKNIAGMDSVFQIRMKKSRKIYDRIIYDDFSIELALSDIFKAIAYGYMSAHVASAAGPMIAKYINYEKSIEGDFSRFVDIDLERCLIQLVGLSMLNMFTSKTTNNSFATFFQVTERGKGEWISSVIRKEGE